MDWGGCLGWWGHLGRRGAFVGQLCALRAIHGALGSLVSAPTRYHHEEFDLGTKFRANRNFQDSRNFRIFDVQVIGFTVVLWLDGSALLAWPEQSERFAEHPEGPRVSCERPPTVPSVPNDEGMHPYRTSTSWALPVHQNHLVTKKVLLLRIWGS